MLKSATNYPISQLFDIETNVVYAVPRYQREYTWRKEHWEALFDDVWENDPGYFLGSIICINPTPDALSIQKLELVDGQQRLTTISLLFGAVYHALKDQEAKLDDDQRAELINLKRKLVLKRGDDDIRVIPQVQNNNNTDYRAVLAEIGVIARCDIPSHAGNRRIFKAFRYFQDRITTLTDGKNNRVDSIMSLLERVNKASLVKIEVVSHADAYTLFESLNNRGLPLTAVDLIKNKLLAALEKSEPGKINAYFEDWKRILRYLGDDYATQERFFRQYYNAFKDDLKKIIQVPLATRSNLIQIYEKLIANDPKSFLDQVSTSSRQYAVILLRNQEDLVNGIEKPLRDLERIQGAPSYLLVLYLLVKKEVLGLNSEHLNNVVTMLVSFFVRRNLTDLPPTRDLNRLFMSIIDKINGLAAEAVVYVIRDELVSVSATEDGFRQKLDGSIYEDNSGVTRFILCALAEDGMTRESRVDLWQMEGKQYVWTIEHIFPQGENIPKSWIMMMADGDAKLAKELQETHVHKLGNLTVSGFNANLGNRSFEEKRDRVDRKGRPLGYRNGLKLNEDLANATAWSIDQIESRTKKLADQVTTLFRLA